MATRTRFYELLVRGHPNGGMAAHRRDIVEVVDDTTGAVVLANELPPVALAMEDVDGLLTAENATLLVAISKANADRDAAVAARDAAQQEARTAAQARTEALRVNNTLSTEWHAAMARIAELEAALAETEA